MSKRLNEEVDKTLSVLDNINRVSPNPYLFSKIQERLNDQQTKELNIFPLFRPQSLMLLTTILFLINIYSVVIYWNSNQSTSSNVESFAELYDLNGTESIDYNFE